MAISSAWLCSLGSLQKFERKGQKGPTGKNLGRSRNNTSLELARERGRYIHMIFIYIYIFILLCNRYKSFKRSVNAGIRDIIYTYGCTKMRWGVTGLPWQSWQWLEWRANASFLAGPTTYPQFDQKWIAQSIPTWRFLSYLYDIQYLIIAVGW